MSRLQTFTVLIVTAAAATAAANPRPLPYTYPSEMLQPGQLEIEQYTDLTPVPATPYNGTAATSTLLQADLITEIEYGLIDRLELGLYFQLSNFTGNQDGSTTETPLNYDGIAQRLRYALARPGKWPIDVEVYGEISEFQNEFEVEGKIILQRRFGHLRLMVNLVAEHESYYTGQQQWVLAPTGGFSYEIKPWLNLGLEYWSHGEYGPGAPLGGSAGNAATPVGQFDNAFHSYLGPAVMFQFHHIWWAVAPYLRLDQFNYNPPPPPGTPGSRGAGNEYGEFWLRSVIGIDFN